MKNHARFAWAAEVLHIKPADKILEIGCGTGMAAEQIALKLDTGHITAIDRSQAMLDKAIQRNKTFIKEKRASFLLKDLAGLAPGRHSYQKVFAFNVNLFWTRKEVTKEAAIIRSHLAGRGWLYLFYQPPDAGLIKKIKALIYPNLEREGFELHRELYEKTVSGYCLVFKCVPKK